MTVTTLNDLPRVSSGICLVIVLLAIVLLAVWHVAGAQPTIYRCVEPGGVVYSDRPCAAGADPHEIDDSRITLYAPPPASPRPSTAAPAARPKAARSKKRDAVDANKHRAKCAKLEQALRDVRTKMRTGYGAAEGERLKARQRRLNEQRRAQKCG